MTNKQKKIWEGMWLAQDKRCAICNQKVDLADTGKSSFSLKIVCRACYTKPNVTVILDEMVMELDRSD